MKTRFMAILLSVAVALSGVPAMEVSANPATFETVVETVETEEETTVEEETTEVIVEESVVEETTEEETIVEETTEEGITEESVVEETTEEETTVEEETTEEIAEELVVGETTVEVISEVESNSDEVELEVINPSIKAVGSNGKEYKDVTYLSMATVKALPADAQSAYYDMCDTIAEWYESGIDVKEVVLAADDESVIIRYKMPVEILFSESVQSSFIVEENMELLNSVAIAEEDFGGVPFVQNDTLMKNENYFKNQLSANAKKIYDAGKTSIVKNGSNTINVTYSGYVNLKLEPLDGISALVNTYPNKFNWMDLGGYGGLEGEGIYRSATRKTTWNFRIGKSSHYNNSLEAQADSKVNSLVQAAQAYAVQNHPDNHIYGMIEYFDKWICENNYYNYDGVNDGMSGTSAAYFYCHSCYGILLKGYGVCESYALAMTRLLDAVGIRNMYVVGDCGTPDSGHAWNYVEMPDGKWYLLDSTWNDGGSKSNKEWFLVKNDGEHFAKGRRFVSGKTFKYNALAKDNYTKTNTEVMLNASEAMLSPGKTKDLKVVTKTNYFKEFDVVWTSSNTNVATVSANGKVKAVAPGKAVITCNVAGKNLTSTIYVYKWDKLTFATDGTANSKLSYVNNDNAFDGNDVQTIIVNVGNQTGSSLTSEQLAAKLNIKAPVVKSSNPKVVAVDSTFSGNTVSLKVSPLKVGSATITTSFNGKKATLTVKVSQNMDATWFDFSKVTNVEYNGKAFKPEVKLSDAGKAVSPKPTFKVTYTNNKDAGTGTVTVTGTGSYGGTVTKYFNIAQKDASAATFNKCTASKTYNGKAQAAATTVKLGNVVLKAGTDYDVLYNGSTTVPTNAGVYTVTIRTKGNYKTTTLSTLVSGNTATYEIKANKIKNVTVTCPTSIKTGKVLNYKVKIGNNELPTNNYTALITDMNGSIVSSYTEPGKYKLVIVITGNNVLTTETKSSFTKTFTVKK